MFLLNFLGWYMQAHDLEKLFWFSNFIFKISLAILFLNKDCQDHIGLCLNPFVCLQLHLLLRCSCWFMCMCMFFKNRVLEEHGHLINGYVTISKDNMNKPIPYKYFISSHDKEVYEFIYKPCPKEVIVNRCLFISSNCLIDRGKELSSFTIIVFDLL